MKMVTWWRKYPLADLMSIGRKQAKAEQVAECEPGEIYCSEGCVSDFLRCDKKRDCRLGEDELGCSCTDHIRQLHPEQICDAYSDCPDSSDEEGCDDGCPEGFFSCDHNRCIPMSNVCDGARQCVDSTDEANCDAQLCPPGQLACGDRQCVYNTRICDGVPDCSDGKDENSCLKLATTESRLHDYEAFDHEGHLFYRKNGRWQPVCSMGDDDLFDHLCKISGHARLRNRKYQLIPFGNFTEFASTTTSRQPQLEDFKTGFVHLRSNIRHVTGQACGNAPRCVKPKRTKRIVGGTPAGVNCHPWAVALYNHGKQKCMAIVVSNQWLLTAAHCFREYRHSPIETNDIALIRMDRPVVFSDFIRPPCIPPSSAPDPPTGLVCYIVGWGYPNEQSSTIVNDLQQVNLEVMDATACNATQEFEGHVGKGHLCMTHGPHRRDACQGDSGGPLICRDEEGRDYLAGVTSTGYGCARPNTPGIWTKVVHYADWIEKTLRTPGHMVRVGANGDCLGFKCTLGDCVYSFFRCDGSHDCLIDGSDEDNCPG